jgi:RNA polymerase sigma-70 factor (ECF subfamily)
MVQIAGCRTEAEDIVQEAFVRAFVALKSFKHNSAFYTWLYRIAVNLAISYLRKKEPATSLDVGRESGGPEPVDQSGSPMDKLMRKERGPLIAAAFAKLNSEYRTILTLREIERFDYQTIAKILCVKIGTVRSRLHRARMQMRKLLDVAV